MLQFRRSNRRISALLACSMLLAQLNVSAMAACNSTVSADAGSSQCKCGTGKCGTDSCCCSLRKAAQAEQPTPQKRSCCNRGADTAEQAPVEATSGEAIDSAQAGHCHCRAKVPAPLDTPRRAFETDSIRLLALVLSHESAVTVEDRFFSSWPVDLPCGIHRPASVQQLYCCWLV